MSFIDTRMQENDQCSYHFLILVQWCWPRDVKVHLESNRFDSKIVQVWNRVFSKFLKKILMRSYSRKSFIFYVQLQGFLRFKRCWFIHLYFFTLLDRCDGMLTNCDRNSTWKIFRKKTQQYKIRFFGYDSLKSYTYAIWYFKE